jgi:hypothetical protein
MNKEILDGGYIAGNVKKPAMEVGCMHRGLFHTKQENVQTPMGI